jgi:DNA-binding LytR/AlgR family response regulator
MKERLRYVETMDRRIAHWDETIEQLRRRIQSATTEDKERLLGQIAELKSKRDEFKTRVDSIRAFSEDDWKHMVISVERTEHEFETALNKLSEKLES